MQVSVLTIDTFGNAKQVRDVGPTAHFQFFRYPFEAHSRFLSQRTRQTLLFPGLFSAWFNYKIPASAEAIETVNLLLT
jgi:hypothetical protein